MATQIINISSKYKDIISKCSLISSGSPALYQLRPKKEEIGTLTRMTVGERNPEKKNKTILLVGETGTGKSALINTLINYSMGVKFEDDIWFQIVEDEKRSQSESQTSDVIVYEIFGFEDQTLPYSLTIIDTPGYGDTRGIEHDVIVSQRLLDLFSSDDGVQEMNAVGLVMKASDNRLSDRLRYVFDSVVSLFGKNVEKNIVALITHSDGMTPENALEALEAAKMKCAKDEEKQPVHFLFNNCQSTERTQRNKRPLGNAWDVTEEEMGKFTDFLEKSRPQKMMVTVEVLNERFRLAACINNLQGRIELIELKQTEIKQVQEALKKHEHEMKNNEEFTVEVDEVYKDKEPIRGGGWLWFFLEGATCCTVCEETCHHPCTVAPKPKDCKVIKDGRCIVCTNKCPVSGHVKENWRFVNKTRKVQKTQQDMKEKYEENKAESEKKSSFLENLEMEMKDLTAEKIRLLEESYQHVFNLDQIALNVNSPSTHVHLDFLIEKMKEKGDTEKVQKLEEMKSQRDKRVPTVLQVVYAKIIAAGRKTKDVCFLSDSSSNWTGV
ncbi:uncharacterized protein LOC108874629 isoform X1 [Lates calcarifer]|uniref:Uncharacterized protein LOC108874629 isoform X1 n=1 Tax=Lates calcarifer TaxID=8187 RepID=A0A4W6CS14_LATCA|nr:uncharacterized protein LOC108874629 isoform X1 [Lates calcarifer]